MEDKQMTTTGISQWAKATRAMGLSWLALALAASIADFLITRGPPNPQAMFGGHFIAMLLLSAGPWVVGAIFVCGIVAAIRGWFHPATAGWRAIGIGVLAALLGFGSACLAFMV